MTVSVAKFIKHLLNNLNVASYLTLIILGDRYCFTVLHVKELRHMLLEGSRVEISQAVSTLHCHTILLPRMGCSWRR